jgi:hypothetical protein
MQTDRRDLYVKGREIVDAARTASFCTMKALGVEHVEPRRFAGHVRVQNGDRVGRYRSDGHEGHPTLLAPVVYVFSRAATTGETTEAVETTSGAASV